MKVLCFACYLFAIFSSQTIFSKASPLQGHNVAQAGEHEFDFLVSISIKNYLRIPEEEDNHVCGGSLVTTLHVLTAAHCRCRGTLVRLDDFTVKLGHDLRNPEANFSISAWKTFEKTKCPLIIKRDYYSSNDISVVKLSEDVGAKLNRIIKLPVLNYSPVDKLYGKSVVTAGWGYVNNERNPRYAQKVTLTTISLEQCQKNINNAPIARRKNGIPVRGTVTLEENILCSNANSKPGVPPYSILGKGDSGGPLLIEGNEIIAINEATSPNEGSDYVNYEQNLHVSLLPYRKFIEDATKDRKFSRCCGNK